MLKIQLKFFYVLIIILFLFLIKVSYDAFFYISKEILDLSRIYFIEENRNSYQIKFILNKKFHSGILSKLKFYSNFFLSNFFYPFIIIS